MPRSIQDILDHADELAERFEGYEADERPVEEYLLQRAALNRARSERQIVDAVVIARAAGISSNKIGEILGFRDPPSHRWLITTTLRRVGRRKNI